MISEDRKKDLKEWLDRNDGAYVGNGWKDEAMRRFAGFVKVVLDMNQEIVERGKRIAELEEYLAEERHRRRSMERSRP